MDPSWRGVVLDGLQILVETLDLTADAAHQASLEARVVERNAGTKNVLCLAQGTETGIVGRDLVDHVISNLVLVRVRERIEDVDGVKAAITKERRAPAGGGVRGERSRTLGRAVRAFQVGVHRECKGAREELGCLGRVLPIDARSSEEILRMGALSR
jgi:hypothetical protein